MPEGEIMRRNKHLKVISRSFAGLVVRFGLCVIACSAFVTLVQAQGETFGAFRGQARDQNGAGIDRVQFEIKNKERGFVRTRYTNKDGDFYDNNYMPGDYEVTVSKTGYVTQSLFARVPVTQSVIVIPLPAILAVETS